MVPPRREKRGGGDMKWGMYTGRCLTDSGDGSALSNLKEKNNFQ